MLPPEEDSPRARQFMTLRQQPRIRRPLFLSSMRLWRQEGKLKIANRTIAGRKQFMPDIQN